MSAWDRLELVVEGQCTLSTRDKLVVGDNRYLPLGSIGTGGRGQKILSNWDRLVAGDNY